MTSTATIGLVVEGDGEVVALPLLVRRIAAEVFGRWDVELLSPWRLKRSQLPFDEYLHNAVRAKSREIRSGGILVVADLDDDDCAVPLAAQLRDLAKPVPVEVTIAVREFEAWSLAAVESLREHPDLRPDAAYPGNPELPRGAKERLSGMMTRPYRERLHQPRFATMMDLTEGRRARSFEHLVACVGRLLGSTVAPGRIGR